MLPFPSTKCPIAVFSNNLKISFSDSVQHHKVQQTKQQILIPSYENIWRFGNICYTYDSPIINDLRDVTSVVPNGVGDAYM